MSLLPRTGKIIGPDTRYIEVNPITQELLIYTTLEACHLKDKKLKRLHYLIDKIKPS